MILLSCNGDNEKTRRVAVKPDRGSIAEKEEWKKIFDKNQEWADQAWRKLYAAIDEPIILESETEQYRLTVQHPYNIPPVIYRISKTDGAYWITRKEYLMTKPDGTGIDTLLHKSVTRITRQDWKSLLDRLNKIDFRNMKSDDTEGWLDPTYLVLEGWIPDHGYQSVVKIFEHKPALFV